MVPALQAKLLRFLEEKAFKRVGGSADIRVDVRVIAATNRKLEEEVTAGTLPRGPVLPAERAADRAAAAARPAPRTSRCSSTSTSTSTTGSSGSSVRGVDAGGDASSCRRYGWPGNVRELRNARRARDAAGRRDTADAGRLPGGRGRRGASATACSSCRRTGIDLEQLERVAGRPGARADRLESDEGRGAARAEPRSDPLPDREVRARKSQVACGPRE